jgi:hypothetical protein
MPLDRQELCEALLREIGSRVKGLEEVEDLSIAQATIHALNICGDTEKGVKAFLDAVGRDSVTFFEEDIDGRLSITLDKSGLEVSEIDFNAEVPSCDVFAQHEYTGRCLEDFRDLSYAEKEKVIKKIAPFWRIDLFLYSRECYVNVPHRHYFAGAKVKLGWEEFNPENVEMAKERIEKVTSPYITELVEANKQYLKEVG